MTTHACRAEYAEYVDAHLRSPPERNAEHAPFALRHGFAKLREQRIQGSRAHVLARGL